MTYKYLKASPLYGKTQQETYIDLFQETLDLQFSNASDLFTVEEEVTFGSQTYQDVDVRINHVVSSATGKNLGDDYKQVLFQDLAHSVGLGFIYQFTDNYWITINTERIKNLAASAYLKRCNNALRWRDETGAYYSEPCSIGYEILRNINNESPSSLIVLPQGRIEVICQYNDRTNLIRPNQRFLFGNEDNWTAYKIAGGGINNYQNTETINNTTVGFIRLTMAVDYISDNDDLTLGIAYEDKNLYAITVSPATDITGVASTTAQLHAIVTLNGSTVDRDVEWVSSNTAKTTVDSNGLVTIVTTTGTAEITCNLEGDANIISAHVNVIATAGTNYQVMILPVAYTSGTLTSLVFLNGGATKDTITRASGSFITDGFAAQQIIIVSGTTNNNNQFTIFNVTTLVITLIATDTLTNETSNAVIDNVELTNKNYVLEDDTQIYDVYLYQNATKLANVFNFSLEGNGVPNVNYTYAATDGTNTFSVKNITKFLTDHLDVTCTCVAIGSVPPISHVGIQEINLKGVW